MKSKVKNWFKILLKMIFIYSFVGGFYLLIETAYRQYTFVEMFYLAGCVGLVAMFFNNIYSYETDFLLQIFIVGTLCLFGEGLVGNWLNMDYNMWDYRNLPCSFWNDQINAFFAVIWYALVAVAIPILDYIDWQLFGYLKDTPPYYKVFGKKIFQFKKH